METIYILIIFAFVITSFLLAKSRLHLKSYYEKAQRSYEDEKRINSDRGVKIDLLTDENKLLKEKILAFSLSDEIFPGSEENYNRVKEDLTKAEVI